MIGRHLIIMSLFNKGFGSVFVIIMIGEWLT